MKIADYRINTVLNSRAHWIREYILIDENGIEGRGSAPKGETLSQRELGALQSNSSTHHEVASLLSNLKGSALSQLEFDDVLLEKKLPASDTFALSTAFFDLEYRLDNERKNISPSSIRFFFNILNGGTHAYTNPIKSDFHEYLLVAPAKIKYRDSIEDFLRLYKRAVDRLGQLPTIQIGNNLVADLGPRSNHEALRLLNEIKLQEQLSDYAIMVDAASTGHMTDGHYVLNIAEKKKLRPEEYVDYWMNLIELGEISYLEDPFHENDLDSWMRLAKEQSGCVLVGDDLHSGDPEKFAQLTREGLMGAAMVKPDQAITISATNAIVEEARRNGLEIILSHRSVGTDTDFLGKYMLSNNLTMAKFGPFLNDFSAIIQMNQILRNLSE